MAETPFNTAFFPEPGIPEELAPGLRRLVAPNASAMTFRGTNTYLLGEAEIAVIDPGPDDPAHYDAILRTVGRAGRISHVLVTHSHVDHSPLAARLARAADAPVLALGDSFSQRSELMARLAARFDLGGGEGVDAGFRPDRRLADGEVVHGGEWQLEALATPGHFSNHLCFAWPGEQAVFSGDHVMGWATTLVSPPDGDLTAFMASLARMAARGDDRCYFPGHGAELADPLGMVAYLADHRRNRESQILAALDDGDATPLALAQRIYTEIPVELIPAAARNVFAHLVDLVERNRAEAVDDLSPTTAFRLIGR
ncbi:MAG: MBL fold metallo-hydrolase [Rhodobacteraceae bacterium]|nr:MBL fold metallo-hydrolase [Paracoccaceae bacterium]